MKLSSVFQTLTIAACSTPGLATLLFDRVPSQLDIGDRVKLNWTADHDYSLSLTLMRHPSTGRTYNDYGVPTQVFYDLPMASGNMSYDWIVPNVTAFTGDRFSLKLSGEGPMDSAGTTNSTNLFELPENSSVPIRSLPQSQYDCNPTPWVWIVAITCGCVGAFLLGVAIGILGDRLRQRKKKARAGFEQVANETASPKMRRKELPRGADA